MLIQVRDLMRESWSLYKNNFALFAKIIAWLIIPVIILSFLPYLISSPVIFLAVNFLLSLLYWVFSIFIFIALILTMNTLLKGESVNLRSIYNLSYSKIFWGVIISILIALAVGAAPLIFIISGIIFSAALAVFTGIFLMVIPGIIFSIWLSFGLYTFILENKKVIESLSASRQLVKGRFWSVLWRWMAPNFVYGIILCIIILIPLYIIDFAIGQLGASFTAIPPWWSILIANVVPLFATPLFYAVGFILYTSLKKEKVATLPQ